MQFHQFTFEIFRTAFIQNLPKQLIAFKRCHKECKRCKKIPESINFLFVYNFYFIVFWKPIDNDLSSLWAGLGNLSVRTKIFLRHKPNPEHKPKPEP